MTGAADPQVVARARRSLGASEPAIHALAGRLLESRGASGVLLDAGCGSGNFTRVLGPRFRRVIGVDAVRYDGLPLHVEFREADLDRDTLPLPDGAVDVAAAIEIIEHLENPRRFVRELARVTRPGGLVLVSTPNQLSALSLMTLVFKQRFSAFQDGAYPAHRTALLEVDLRRIAAECRMADVEVAYTLRGRLPLSSAHYPRVIAHAFPRALSDNLVMIGRRT